MTKDILKLLYEEWVFWSSLIDRVLCCVNEYFPICLLLEGLLKLAYRNNTFESFFITRELRDFLCLGDLLICG